MTPEELRAGQVESRSISRTVYRNREIRFEGLDEPVIVTPSGDAYVRTYRMEHGVRMPAGTVRIGIVTRQGDQWVLMKTRDRERTGKSAKRQQKRARLRHRQAQEKAGTANQDAPA